MEAVNVIKLVCDKVPGDNCLLDSMTVNVYLCNCVTWKS